MYLHEKRQPRIDLSQDALGLRKDPVQGFGCGGAEVMPAEGKAKVFEKIMRYRGALSEDE